MSRAWMPLYVADYLADTAHLNATESGAYLHLIMHYWNTGGLPDDPKRLQKIARLTPHQWQKISPLLGKFFHDGWKHRRIDQELRKADEISEKRAAAANTRHAKPHADACKSNANAMQLNTHARGLLQSPSQSPEKKETSASHSRASDWPADFFDQFLNEYPKKVEKQATMRKLEALRRSGKLPWRVLLDGVLRYRDATAGTEQQFIKSPLVWLNKGCWDDEPAALVRATGPPRERRNGFDVVREECLQEMENDQRVDDPEPRFDLDLTPARPGVG